YIAKLVQKPCPSAGSLDDHVVLGTLVVKVVKSGLSKLGDVLGIPELAVELDRGLDGAVVGEHADISAADTRAEQETEVKHTLAVKGDFLGLARHVGEHEGSARERVDKALAELFLVSTA
ncbi:unnamed protein product, partial [Durusdinium trenchii]